MIPLFTAQLILSLFYLFDTAAMNFVHLPLGFLLLTAVYLSSMLETYLFRFCYRRIKQKGWLAR